MHVEHIVQEANMHRYEVSLPLLRPLFKRSSDTAPTISDISSRIMRNWSHHARGGSLQFLAGNGGSFGGGSSASAVAGGAGAAPGATTTNPSTRYQIGRRTSSSDDTIAYSIKLSNGGDYGGKGGESSMERGRVKGSNEYEVRPFGEVLVTKTVMVGEERKNHDRNMDFMV